MTAQENFRAKKYFFSKKNLMIALYPEKATLKNFK